MMILAHALTKWCALMDVEQVASREASLALIGIIHIELNARRKHSSYEQSGGGWLTRDNKRGLMMESQRSFSFVTWQIEKNKCFGSLSILHISLLKNIIRRKLHKVSLLASYNVSAVFPKCFMPLGCCLWCLFPIVYGGTYLGNCINMNTHVFNPGLLIW